MQLRRWTSYLLAGSLLASSAQWAFAQRDLKDIPTPDPEEERKALKLADGFEINLFAADPMIHKPIQMNFDTQGRLWVAASEVYPQIAPGQVANDKILVLEDTDGDGTADKTTVFADGLLIPTAVIPGDGGAYVANSTELLHLKDTDGDGKADQSRIVLSGFGTEDTHHILHTFRWGFDGLLYMNQSIYIHSHIETPYGVKRLNAGGIWRFRPETLELDVFARGWVNTWGHHFDRYGQSFATDGAGGEGINYVVPGAAYLTAANFARILHGLNPGSPKYCGLEMVDGRHLPDDWQGDLITHDFRGHRVCRFKLTQEGSAYVSKQMPDLISTSHVAFRPIDVKMGPDGAIYIADWYNPIIQHGEVDFRDERRDHTHGRIWRVTAKGRKTVERPKLVGASVEELLEQLKAPETYTRQQAKLVLREMDKAKVGPAIAPWAAKIGKDDPNGDQYRLEALWTAVAINRVEADLLRTLLKSSNENVRAAAVRTLGHWHGPMEDSLDLLAKAVDDEHPRVQLEAVRVLGAIPSAKAAALALKVADQKRDEWLDYALWLTARESKPHWLEAIKAGEPELLGHLERVIYAIQASESNEVIPLLVDLVNQDKISNDLQPKVLQLIGSLGNPDQLRLVLDLATGGKQSAERKQQLLASLLEARAKRNVVPAGDLAALKPLLSDKDAGVRAAALRAAGEWEVKALVPQIIEAAKSGDGSDDGSDGQRVAAITALSRLASPESSAALLDLAKGEGAEGIKFEAARGLIAQQAAQAPAVALGLMKQTKNAEFQAGLVTAFLNQKNGAAQLTAALKGQSIPEDAAKIALRTVTGGGRQEPALVEALTAAGGITGEAKAMTPEQTAAFVNEVKTSGNAARGEAIFRRADLSCLKCHAIGGTGGRVGPDLVSIGASAQVDYLIDSLYLPNKAVKENYNTWVVATDEGKIFTGIQLRRSETELVLRDAEDREVSIPVKQIDEQVAGTSLMPAGLTDKLTRAETVDLVRFLSELGKEGGYTLGRADVARRWDALLWNKAAWDLLSKSKDDELVRKREGLDWQAAYSQVNGELPLSELPSLRTWSEKPNTNRDVAILRTTLDVTTPGTFGLKLGDVEGIRLWVDGRPVEASETAAVDLKESGPHTVTLAVDVAKRQKPVRLELVPAKDSTGRAKWQIGK